MEDYREGRKMINISATVLLLRVANRVFDDINHDLNTIMNELQEQISF